MYHESSHLGDEYGDRFDAERLDWTREVLRRLGRLQQRAVALHGERSYALRDELRLERAGSALGLDFPAARAHTERRADPAGRR